MMQFEMTTDLAQAVPKELAFNFEELKAELSERLDYYRGIVVTEDTIKESKDDRANLNKLRTAIDTRRKDIKKAYLQPYNEFEAKCKELTVLIDEPIKAIDVQLQAFEDKRKEEKLQEVRTEYESVISETFRDIIPFERILDQKWLNATTTMKSVKEALRDWSKRVGADMLAMDAVEEEYKIAVRQKYVETLDIGRALAHRDELKAAQEAFRAREEAKAALEAQKAAQAINPPQIESLTPQTAQEPAPAPAEEKRYALTLQFDLTRDQAIALRRFLDENNINYKKIA